MKKNIITIILVVLIVIILLFKFIKPKSDILNLGQNTVQTEELTNKNTTNVYLYDAKENKIQNVELEVLKVDLLDIDDYIDIILKNSKFISKKMNLLAVYKLNDTDIIIKLSDGFKDLTKETMNGLSESIKKTLIEKYNLQKIDIQIDSTN